MFAWLAVAVLLLLNLQIGIISHHYSAASTEASTDSLSTPPIFTQVFCLDMICIAYFDVCMCVCWTQLPGLETVSVTHMLP